MALIRDSDLIHCCWTTSLVTSVLIHLILVRHKENVRLS